MVVVIKDKIPCQCDFSCSWRSVLNRKNWPRCFL